jgi:glucose-1-phosphate cytidylyltransferase
MKLVIFAGGLGTRLMEETEARPKPMVEIGGKPILWHIMKIYESQGFSDFIVCLGYKQAMIKEYFMNYYFTNSDVTIDLSSNQITVLNSTQENFKVTLVDTGYATNTAGRLKRVKKYIGNETFMLTYGDGLSDVDLKKIVEFHNLKGRLLTLTSIQIPGKFGNLDLDDNGNLLRFVEKPEGDGVWINGGFMVLEPEIFKYLEGEMDDIQFEKGPLIELTKLNQVSAFKHLGFWKCMDAMRDKVELEELWQTGCAPWKIWK